jgi:dephospho-CoA kinase
VLLVGLTGGIASGKSTVARMLEQRGAVVIDADVLARRAVDAGTPGHEAVIRRFGPEVLAPDGDIDRSALAARVFGDAGSRRDLEAIVHPEVARLFAEAVEPYRDTDRIVVYVVPLLLEAGLERAFDVIVAVAAPEELRIERLVRHREMPERDAAARIATQLPDAERSRVATHVVRNDGSLEDLERRVGRVFNRLTSARARARESPGA